MASDTSVIEKDSQSNSASDQVVLRSPKQIAWSRFKRNRVAVFSGFVALFFIACAFLAPVICGLLNLSPTKTYPDALDEFGMPIGAIGGMSARHPLGVEPGAGRDLLAMLLYGSRISFTVA